MSIALKDLNRKQDTSTMPATEEMIEKVWQNGSIINGHDPNKYRQDACGAWIIKEKYGSKDSVYGWEIDKISYSLNGSGGTQNLRPLQWENKEAKIIHGELISFVKAVGPKNI